VLIPIDEVVTFDVVTHLASTGASTNADSSGTYEVYEETTDTAILSAQALVLRAGATGVYRGTFTASAANGFEAGKWYSVVAASTVSSVAGKAVAMHFRVAPAESVAGVPEVDVTHAGGVAGAIPAVAAGAVGGLPVLDARFRVLARDGGAQIAIAQTGTLSTTQATTTLTGYGDDHFNNRFMIWWPDVSGNGAAIITDYDSATGMLTWSPAIAGAPSNGDSGFLFPATTGLAVGDRTGSLSGSVGSLGATAKSDVNAEVLDVLNVDTFSQPGQTTPAATTSIRLMLAWIYKAWRNKSTQDATDYKLYNDDTTTVDQKATVSDSGTVFTRDEVGTGP